VAKTLSCLLVASLTLACVSEPLPNPPPLRQETDRRGYPITPRPACGPATIAELSGRSGVNFDALVAAVRGGEPATCGADRDAMPLDSAIAWGRPDVVRVLLEAGADPNARWTSRGDRFPLQEAIEPWYADSHRHRREIVGLLLQHGADPNARWCPFESRQGAPPLMPACESSGGVTPLIAAAFYDQADTTYLLLDAGADPAALDGQGFSALDYAKGRAVFELLLGARFPDPLARREQAQTFRKHLPAHPWLPPAPPPPSPTAEDVQALISASARGSPRAR
jgi:hypothetical protein